MTPGQGSPGTHRPEGKTESAGDPVTLSPCHPVTLSPEERALYEWQAGVAGFGEGGQERLKGSSVLVSRCGGVGGAVAYQLAAAGVGRLVLAHAGNVRPDDLNRQLLMTYGGIGRPRTESARRRLRELNPFVEVEGVAENVSEDNVERLVAAVDLVVSAAPVFEERLLLNAAAVRLGKPLVDCAMYELEVQLTTIVPGRTPCLACLVPVPPPAWRRRFPVFGAVAGAVGSLGAMEAIKVLAGLGEPLYGKLLLGDLRDMSFRRVAIARDPGCGVCGERRAPEV
jgi:molybdopterin-synthase adenylyltransferase